MYNWSVDEKELKNVLEVAVFLKKRPEVTRVSVKRKFLIKIRLVKNIHPVVKFKLSKILQEKCRQILISVIEDTNYCF